MKFRDLLRIQEGDITYQAFAIVKDVHNRLAELAFIKMLSVMSSDNPTKKDVRNKKSALALLQQAGIFDANGNLTEPYRD